MLNKIMIIGRVGKEVEVRQVNGSNVANFSVATTEKYKNKNGEQVENTEWHSIQAWGKLAEICQSYVNKGDMLYIEGKVATQSWEDKGVQRQKTQIVCREIKMLGGSKKEKKEDKFVPHNGGLPF
jgi:single-strand DNA-binding protein